MSAHSFLFTRVYLCLVWSGCASTPPLGAPGDSGTLPEYAVGGRGVEEDNEDRYNSAVMILLSDNSFCSGVAISSYHVLTAAHCFCLPTGFETRPGLYVYNGSGCKKTASVMGVFQSARARGTKPPSSKGKVIVHEGFLATVIDGRIGRQVADLAVIQLERALEGINPDGEMPEVDVSYNERLTVAGFGPSSYRGSDARVRRFGSNVVTTISTTSELKEFRMGPDGVHPFGGDSGAPCFRETQEGRWLVGINYGFLARGAASESWFTNTFYFREWIEKQKRLKSD